MFQDYDMNAFVRARLRAHNVSLRVFSLCPVAFDKTQNLARMIKGVAWCTVSINNVD